jgi:hypothetical protein
MSHAVRVRSDTARTLEETWDPRAVGVLAIAYQEGSMDQSIAASRALHKLLPRVRASDAADIDAEQMNALLALACRWAARGDIETKIALLQALEQIGDARAVPVVESLLNSYHDTVREAARACLPALQSRLRRTKESATLLRASHSDSIGPGKGELLRPSTEFDLSPPDQLLRPCADERVRG